MTDSGIATAGWFIRDVLGRMRKVTRTWPDGSFACPFCEHPVLAGSTKGCENPWCTAMPSMPVAAAQKIVDDAAAREAADEARQRNLALATERIDADRAERHRRMDEVAAEAKRRGACVGCARWFDFNRGAPKFVKHNAITVCKHGGNR